MDLQEEAVAGVARMPSMLDLLAGWAAEEQRNARRTTAVAIIEVLYAALDAAERGDRPGLH